ncbi:hypothetical protein Y695_04696 [Hydrogenophaga sp. T4]|nr:hypothetical protein Y695_04696 [Hydrogenophaga sp. T4]
MRFLVVGLDLASISDSISWALRLPETIMRR